MSNTVLLILLSIFLFNMIECRQGYCSSKFNSTRDCADQPEREYDQLCKKFTTTGLITTNCLRCHPDWFVYCDCSHCTVGITPGGIALIFFTSLLGVALLVASVYCCCFFIPVCPLARRRYKSQMQRIHNGLLYVSDPDLTQKL
eukprot:c12616_g1_i1.p1 GENE.c12616_g1_i1~~c12616_g1_i1.p1  ORF type:complete len:151 (+),score=29.53 c12616_g1_i1:22-453(+)